MSNHIVRLSKLSEDVLREDFAELDTHLVCGRRRRRDIAVVAWVGQRQLGRRYENM
jgi:hypothetical protein